MRGSATMKVTQHLWFERDMEAELWRDAREFLEKRGNN